MKKIFSIFLFSIFFLVFSECSDKIVSDCEKSKATGDMGFVAQFSSIQKNVLNSYCALSGCHAGNFPASNLNLSSGQSYNNLVQVKSEEMPNLFRVSSGNSAQSYLIQKLKGENSTVMPPTGMLSVAIIDTIAIWIDAGALDN